MKMHVYRVFVDEKGQYGNPVGVIFDLENKIDNHKRQSISAKSGFSECVFVNNTDNFSINIFSPQREISFAGHATLGTAYAINHQMNLKTKKLTGIENEIYISEENDLLWVESKSKSLPGWLLENLQEPKMIDSLEGSQADNFPHTLVWSWVSEEAGIIRARTFAPAWGILEDEANGSGCMLLANKLARDLKVIHGKGSEVFVHPLQPDAAKVGGRVLFERTISIA